VSDDDHGAAQQGLLGRWLGEHLRTADMKLESLLAYRLSRAVVREFKRAVCMQRAGEIAFYSIVAIIPFTALLMFTLVWVTKTIAGPDWSPQDVKNAIEGTLPEMLPGTQPGGITDGIASSLIDDQAALGVFGLALMLITASLAFGAVNRALAAVFKAPRRGAMSSIFLFSVLLSGLGLAIFLALSVIAASTNSGTDSTDLSASLAERALLVRASADAMLLAGFAYLLKFVVQRPLRWSSVMLGGGFFVLCFEVARIGYQFYLSHIAQLNVVYGSLAGTMATVLWFYYVAFMFLSALCLVRVLDDRLYDAS